MTTVSSPAPVSSPTAPAAPDWQAVRADFPVLHQTVHGRPLIYLDNAATSQKPRAVIETLRHYYEKDNANVHRGIHELSNRATAGFEAARERAARFLNARSHEEIIFTRGTTEGINLVAAAWGGQNIRAGDVIVLTEMEHHSNLVPWQLLAQRTGAKLVFLPVNDDRGQLDLNSLEQFLTPRVKLLAPDPHLQLAGHHQPGGRAVRPRPPARHRDPGGRRPERRAPAGGCAGDRLRFPGRSPATRCAGRPASACFTAGRRCWTACRPTMAAAR